MKTLVRSLAIAIALAAPLAHAATPSRGTVYMSSIYGSLYRVGYSFDGTTLTVSSPAQIVQFIRGGGVAVLPDHRVAVVGAGYVSLYDPIGHTVAGSSSMTNANTVTPDPDGTRFWAGWKDTPLAEVPVDPLADGIVHGVGGDDTVATTLTFTPSGDVFYSTGGEFESGNFGRIDMTTFTTTRICAGCWATTVAYDAFSDSLILAGIGHAEQRDPNNPTIVLSSRDDSAEENYLALYPTGDGHLIGTRAGDNGRLVLIDYSATGRLGAASTVIVSADPGGIVDLSGAAGYEPDLIFSDAAEGF
jgi:hypothetical protein